MLAAVVIMVFLVVFGLTISATYFLVEAPASRKRVRLRVEAVRQSAAGPMVTAEGLVFRESVLSGLPFVDRFLFEIPGIRRSSGLSSNRACRSRSAGFFSSHLRWPSAAAWQVFCWNCRGD
jgi:hypothetical protein